MEKETTACSDCPLLAYKDRIEKALQYVEKVMDKEEQERLNQQKFGEGLAAAYAANWKHYQEQLAVWEKLSFIQKKFTKKPEYH